MVLPFGCPLRHDWNNAEMEDAVVVCYSIWHYDYSTRGNKYYPGCPAANSSRELVHLMSRNSSHHAPYGPSSHRRSGCDYSISELEQKKGSTALEHLLEGWGCRRSDHSTQNKQRRVCTLESFTQFCIRHLVDVCSRRPPSREAGCQR